MEFPGGLSPRLINPLNKEKNEDPELGSTSSSVTSPSEYVFHSLSALDILRETVGILFYNPKSFIIITALLICPLSAVILSNVLVDQYIVKKLTVRLLFVAKSSGLPLKPFIKQFCQKFAEMVVSNMLCFPLYITLSLSSKVAVVYSVDCTYSRKRFDLWKFCVIISLIWRRIVVTYLWMCMIIASCLTLYLGVIVSVSIGFSFIGFPPDLILYPAMVVSLIFILILANAIIICNTAIIIAVLEDVSGPRALVRSSFLIKGQTQVGLLIFLGSTIGMTFVEGLFEHKVKILRYVEGDGGGGSRRIWEGPVWVVVYSFVVLIDSMMSAVFYFSCKSYKKESANAENLSVLEVCGIRSKSLDVAERMQRFEFPSETSRH